MDYSRMKTIEADNLEVLRAENEWQRAGAYSVRIQGMNRQHHISLREEFDEHDGDGTKYIVLLDNGYPVATCRFYEEANGEAKLGRVVVLPKYRRQKLGSRVLKEAEQWCMEIGIGKIIVDSRVEAIPFYEKLGFMKMTGQVIISGPFKCVTMQKLLDTHLE